MGKLVIFLCGLVALIGGALVVSARRPEPPPMLRFGINPWAGYEFMFLAQELGFFEREGVQVRLVEFSSVNDARRAFEHRQIDGMAGNLVEALRARYESHRQPTAFLVADTSAGADAVIARADIDSPAKLRGRRIAIEESAPGLPLLEELLTRAGLGLGDVTIVPSVHEDMRRAMDRGDVDAALCYPPVSIALQRDPGRHTLITTADLPEAVVDVFVIDERLARERGPEVAALVRAWDRALEYAASHPDDAYRIMSRRMLITVDQFREQLRGIKVMRSAQQGPLFAEGGRLEQVVQRVDKMLRGLGLVHGPDRTRDLVMHHPPIGTASR